MFKSDKFYFALFLSLSTVFFSGEVEATSVQEKGLDLSEQPKLSRAAREGSGSLDQKAKKKGSRLKKPSARRSMRSQRNTEEEVPVGEQKVKPNKKRFLQRAWEFVGSFREKSLAKDQEKSFRGRERSKKRGRKGYRPPVDPDMEAKTSKPKSIIPGGAVLRYDSKRGMFFWGRSIEEMEQDGAPGSHPNIIQNDSKGLVIRLSGDW